MRMPYQRRTTGPIWNAIAPGELITVLRITRREGRLVVGAAGLEPARPRGQRLLRPSRLPVPPRPQLYRQRLLYFSLASLIRRCLSSSTRSSSVFRCFSACSASTTLRLASAIHLSMDWTQVDTCASSHLKTSACCIIPRRLGWHIAVVSFGSAKNRDHSFGGTWLSGTDHVTSFPFRSVAFGRPTRLTLPAMSPSLMIRLTGVGMEAASGFEPLNRGFADLRLGHLATPPRREHRRNGAGDGAGNGIRTRDPDLGKVVLYH